MIRVYAHFLENKNIIDSGNFNAGFENISILEIAEMISSLIPSEIAVTESNDPRSYRQNSDKLLSTGFKNEYAVRDAIKEITEKFESGKIKDKDEFYTVKTMKKLNLHK